MTVVYRKVEPDSTPPESFEFPQGGKLASDNRWVMMAQLIPWSEFESEYAQNFATSGIGKISPSTFLHVKVLKTVEQVSATSCTVIYLVTRNTLYIDIGCNHRTFST